MGALTNPLQAIVAKAQAALPVNTGAVVATAERTRSAARPPVLLIDVSGSMLSPAWGGRSKYALLVEAVAAVAATSEFERILAFSSSVKECTAATIPMPAGGTALHLGLKTAAERAGRILLVSDGEPDEPDLAMQVAQAFRGTIDVLYIGPDSNAAAMRFLGDLAAAGRGTYHGSDIAKASAPRLEHTMTRLLLGER